MSFIDDYKLMTSLAHLHKTWERESKSPDIEGSHREWIKGTAYGINLAMRHVKAYLDERKRMEK